MAVSTVKSRLVIFDLDGTLGVLPVDWYELKKKVEEHLRGEDRLNRIVLVLGRDEALEGEARARFREAYAIIQQYEQQGAQEFLPSEFVVRYLKAVGARGGMVAVCSNNMTSTVTMVLERLGVRSLVSLIVGMDTVTRPKPDPEGILQILEKLKVARDETIFVGDTNTDREAAQAASIQYVAVDSSEFRQLE